MILRSVALLRVVKTPCLAPLTPKSDQGRAGTSEPAQTQGQAVYLLPNSVLQHHSWVSSSVRAEMQARLQDPRKRSFEVGAEKFRQLKS